MKWYCSCVPSPLSVFGPFGQQLGFDEICQAGFACGSTSLYEWKSWRFIPPWMKKAPAKWGLAMPGPWMKSTWTGLTFLGGREFVRKTTLMMAEDVQECPNLQVFFLSMSKLPAYLFGFWVLSETAKRVLKNFALRVTWNNQPKVHPALFATRPLNSLPPPTAPKIAMKTCL